MSRRQRRPADPAADLGPRVLHDRGELMVAFEPDPDRPHLNSEVKRTRRYDPLRQMEKLPVPLFLAAERFRDKYALKEGAREGEGSMHREPWQRCHYEAKRADASAEVTGSLQAVGLRLSAVFVGAVIRYQKLREIERELSMRNGDAGRLVVEALNNLRDYQTELGG